MNKFALFGLFLLASCQHLSGGSNNAGEETRRTISEASKSIPKKWNTPFPVKSIEHVSWERLNDPFLQNLIAQGLIKNLSIEDALLRIETATLNLDQVDNILGPRFLLGRSNANASRSTESGFTDAYNLSNSIQYQVDLWGRNKRTVTSSKISLQQQKIQSEATKIFIAQSIASLYIDIRVRDEIIELQKKQIEIQKKQLDLSKVRLEAGAITRLSVDQINVSIQRLISSLETLKNQRNDLQRNLGVLLGLPPQEFQLQPAKLIPFELPRLHPDTPILLVMNRTEMRLSECELLDVGISLDNARDAWLPSLTVSGTANNSGFSVFDFLSADGLIGIINAGLSAALYENGDRAKDIRRAEISQQRSKIRYKQAILTALDEVEGILNRQQRNIRQIEIQKLEAEAQDRVTGITRVQYESGSASAFDLIREQSNELTAQQSRLLNWSEGVSTYISALGALSVNPNEISNNNTETTNLSCASL